MNDNNNVSFGLLPVGFRLALIGEWHGATCVARSCLAEGQRTVRVGLCQDHLLVNRALQRTDTLTIRFLVGLSLVEFCLFWGSSRDGTSIRNSLKKMAAIDPGDHAWGSQFASRLAIAEPMKSIDTMPIFGKNPDLGPHALFMFEAAQRSPSDITNWQTRNGQVETVKPMPPKAPKPTKQEPVAAVPQVVVDPFLALFYKRAGELLDVETFAALEELAKGEPADG